eukprot:TRINITY_DN1550_c0_g1_i2.p1 TRINITY_DN1550_c0_g1~~TRINITY_DN1550_c0_g1_i2.p1  ORF type:complete len:194 (+),score=39.53 TRINITY_DN1550_c0_g1_i2:31-612(+)
MSSVVSELSQLFDFVHITNANGTEQNLIDLYQQFLLQLSVGPKWSLEELTLLRSGVELCSSSSTKWFPQHGCVVVSYKDGANPIHLQLLGLAGWEPKISSKSDGKHYQTKVSKTFFEFFSGEIPAQAETKFWELFAKTKTKTLVYQGDKGNHPECIAVALECLMFESPGDKKGSVEHPSSVIVDSPTVTIQRN